MIFKINSVNKFITKYNMDNSHISVNLHNYGSEFINQTLYFKYNEWKEVDKVKKLHFAFSVKKKIAEQIFKFLFLQQMKRKLR